MGLWWSWSYGSWIYNYLCNQYLSPLKLWVWKKMGFLSFVHRVVIGRMKLGFCITWCSSLVCRDVCWHHIFLMVQSLTWTSREELKKKVFWSTSLETQIWITWNIILIYIFKLVLKKIEESLWILWGGSKLYVLVRCWWWF